MLVYCAGDTKEANRYPIRKCDNLCLPITRRYPAGTTPWLQQLCNIIFARFLSGRLFGPGLLVLSVKAWFRQLISTAEFRIPAREEPALRQRLRQVEFRELCRPKPRIWSMNEWELNASSQSAGQFCGGCLLHRAFTRKVSGTGRAHQLIARDSSLARNAIFPVERVDFVLLPSRRNFGGT